MKLTISCIINCWNEWTRGCSVRGTYTEICVLKKLQVMHQQQICRNVGWIRTSDAAQDLNLISFTRPREYTEKSVEYLEWWHNLLPDEDFILIECNNFQSGHPKPGLDSWYIYLKPNTFKPTTCSCKPIPRLTSSEGQKIINAVAKNPDYFSW